MGGQPQRHLPEYAITPEELARIDNNFIYHPPLTAQPERYEIIRNEARDLALTLHRFAPPSRERSLALTNLEQAVMWANAAIARNEGNPQ